MLVSLYDLWNMCFLLKYGLWKFQLELWNTNHEWLNQTLSHKVCNETGHHVLSLIESQWNWGSSMIRIFRWRESHCRTNTSIRRKKEIQKIRTMRITVWDPSMKVNHLSKVIWDRKIITEFTRLISFTRIGKPVLLMNVKASKNKDISRWVNRENLIYVRRNRIKNFAQRRRPIEGKK